MEKIRVFISFSHHDLEIARTLQEFLQKNYGMKIFLSNTSISPSDDYMKEIIVNLECCEVFVPILSAHFKESFFCNQEVGFAVALKEKIRIVPILTDKVKPYGLIDHIQGLKYEASDKYAILKAPTKFLLLLCEHKAFHSLSERAIDNLVATFIQSSDWKTTSCGVFIFPKLKTLLNKEHLALIAQAARENKAVYSANKVFPKLMSFLESCGIDFSEEK